MLYPGASPSLPTLPAWLRTPPAQWDAQTLDREALYSHARSLREHPRFDLARRSFAANMLHAFETHQGLNRLLRTEDQLAFQAYVLTLHHRRDPADPESGATYSQLLEMYGVGRIASRSVVKKLVSLNRLRGHLRVTPASRGRRLLEPTDQLIATMAVWFGANLAAVEQIAPLPQPAPDLAANATVLCEVMSYGVYGYLRGGFVLSLDYPEVRAFMAREHGYLVLMAIVESMHEKAGDGPARVMAAVPSMALSRRLKVARGTVRNLLTMATEHGWVREVTRGGHEVELDPGFAHRCGEWMALELVWMAGMVAAACAALPAAHTQPRPQPQPQPA
ncbi:MAG TPA: hypothetical protein VLA16_03575 [Ideonella sp.]|nr:hypothetical protein [Ideonella sp.]